MFPTRLHLFLRIKDETFYVEDTTLCALVTQKTIHYGTTHKTRRIRRNAE